MVIPYINREVKALLIIGGALLLVCCGGSGGGAMKVGRESKQRVMTESSADLRVVMSENGRPSYIFETPLLEGYTLAAEPYREFREGVKITTFSDDSLHTENSVLRANYAIYYEDRQLWETRGDVEVVKSDGKELYSQQLYWNAQTKRIFSNVDTRIVDSVSGDIYDGEGFESDEAMEQWSFRRMKGQLKMESKKMGKGEQNEKK